jgi:hypothetical protein
MKITNIVDSGLNLSRFDKDDIFNREVKICSSQLRDWKAALKMHSLGRKNGYGLEAWALSFWSCF